MPDSASLVDDEIVVSLIEDHKGLRDGIRWMLESTEGFLCNGSYGSVEEALEYWESNRPIHQQVILMDIGLPGVQGDGGRAHCS